MTLFTKIRQAVQRTIWPYGTVARIQRGYLKGYRFMVSENSGWSPILGRWEPESHRVFARLIKPGQTVFDLGANNGIHSLLFSKLVGSGGKVFSFEPLPENIAEIEKNISLNSISNIRIIPAAIGDQDGETTFFLGHFNKQGSIVGIGSQTGKQVPVKLMTLKTVIAKERANPDFIKIDIEGAESSALLGFGELISKIRPVFFIELHTPEQDEKVGKILQQYNYEAYRLTEKHIENDRGIPYAEKIKNLNLPYPQPDGIWGTILAFPAKP